MEKTTYGVSKEILKYPETAVAVSVVLDRDAFATIAGANDGVVPAGTILNFDLKNRATKAVPSTGDAAAVGVLRHDTKLSAKEADGAAAVIQGFIDLDKIPTAPTAAQETALRQITFMR